MKKWMSVILCFIYLIQVLTRSNRELMKQQITQMRARGFNVR